MDWPVCKTCKNMGTTTGICNSCTKRYSEYVPNYKKPQTNADKYIRNATDEELANFIAKAQADILRTVGRALKYPGDLVRDCDLEDAADDWLNWLKQEVESDGMLS